MTSKPKNGTGPRGQRTSTMETSASFFESRIKTYGFEVEPDLALLDIRFSARDLGVLARMALGLGQEGGRFRMVLLDLEPEGPGRMSLLTSPQWMSSLERLLETFVSSVRLEKHFPVDLLHFQGPHFGDRYGIADAAFSALEKASISWLAGGCVGSSIQIILPSGLTEKAKTTLATSFRTPDAAK